MSEMNDSSHIRVPALPRRVPLAMICLLLAAVIASLGSTVVAADDEEQPELTWAPLVTLPPVAPPSVTTAHPLADGYALGPADAPVSVEVWEDFQCPYCQRYTQLVEPALIDQYVVSGDVRYVFRNLPFLGDESQWAAVAASLAADQNLFWPFHDYLFSNLQGENVGSYSLDRLLAAGAAVGLDMDAFRAGLTLDAARTRFAEIQTEARQGATALAINATPTVVVDGVPLRSPDLATVSAAIDAALGAAQGAAASPSSSDDSEPAADAGAAEPATPSPAASN